MPKEKIDVGHVYHSLKHSQIRNDIFNFVSNSCEEFSAREITIALHFIERDVIGALIGDGARYKKESSLVGIGLFKCRECNFHAYNIPLFSVTKAGRELAEQNKLKDYAQYSKKTLTSRTKDHELDIEEWTVCKD